MGINILEARRRVMMAQPHIETLVGNQVSFKAEALPLKSLTVGISPVQDLHGQSSPYPPGGGKNKCYDSASHLFPRGDGLAIVENAGLFTAYAKVSKNTDIVFSCGTVPSRNIAYGFESEPAVGVVCNMLSYTVLSTTSFKFNSGNYEYVGFYYGSDTNTNIQIEEGSSATTYAPYSNICPITGHTGVNVSRTGKNLFDSTLESGGVYPDSGNKYSSSIYVRTDYIYLKAGTYTFSQSDTMLNCIRAYDINKVYKRDWGIATLLGTNTVTFANDVYVIVVYRSVTANTNITPEDVTNMQIEIGGTATSYVAPNVDTYPITWETAAGTVFGGTLDVLNGVLTVDRAMVDFGDLTWFYNSTQNFYSTTISDIKPGYSGNSDITDVLCTNLKYKGAGIGWASMPEASFGVVNDSFRVHLSGYERTNQFVTAVTGQKIVYPLDTPTTFTLSEQQISSLLGENCLWNDINGNNTVSFYTH